MAASQEIDPIPSWQGGLVENLSGLPIGEIFSRLYQLGKKLWQRYSLSGMYEVLEYESTLELKDAHGERAIFKKREKVRYLQDNIIAYQDQAWGDGEILLDYRCTPGTAVDIHRPGYKTYVLISLREVKNRGDVDEFNIEWGIRKGFKRTQEAWETEVSHPTRKLKVQIVFPRTRLPLRVTLTEDTRHWTKPLGEELQRRLPDDRWQVTWETDHPRLYERYILKWEW